MRVVENPDLSAVYNAWASYAKSVNKEVSEALSESLQKYVDSGNSFDPQTIERINLLGEYLMSASEATKKYEEALKDETKTKLNLIDPFLSKARKLDEISTDNADTSEKLLVSTLSTLKQSLRVSQENQELNLQAVAARI